MSAVERVHFLVEEQSTETALQVLLPKLLANVAFDIYPSRGKDDLLRRLPERLQGYGWIPNTWRIVILLDKDDDDEVTLRSEIKAIIERSAMHRTPAVVFHVLAVEELEAWFFGDWEAVRAAYPKVAASIPLKAQYRDTDRIKGGTWEAFERVLQAAGYFTTGLRKSEAARSVASLMEPERNKSSSFRQFHELVSGF